jgi:hypothetical protein
MPQSDFFLNIAIVICQLSNYLKVLNRQEGMVFSWLLSKATDSQATANRQLWTVLQSVPQAGRILSTVDRGSPLPKHD